MIFSTINSAGELPIVVVARLRASGSARAVSATPLYRMLANDLRDAILRGAYPPGSRLPTEMSLSEKRGVSRHTAREALRLLREEGLIARRRSAGTTVMADAGSRRFTQTIGDLTDILQYARDARLEVRAFAPAVMSKREIAQVELPRGVAWVCIEGLRRNAPGLPPLALTRIYVRHDICPPKSVITRWTGALNELFAQRSHVSTGRITQEITAVLLSKPEARLLEHTADGAALRTVRRYYDQSGALYQLSVSVHPGDRFTYAMTLNSQG